MSTLVFSFLVLVLTLVKNCALEEKIILRSNKNLVMHETVRNILGFKDSPKYLGKLLPHPNKIDEAPKYMMTLYERFKNNRIAKGRLLGNTVRCIEGQIVEFNGEPMFLFNLSSVVRTEKLISAEIHLYKRKHKAINNSMRRDIDVRMFEIAPHYMAENGKITMRSETFGWQWYDITNSIASCMATRREKPHLFALNFVHENRNGRLKHLNLRKFIRQHSMPFLIIYSNDTQNLSLDHLDSLTEITEDKEVVENEVNGGAVTDVTIATLDKHGNATNVENNNKTTEKAHASNKTAAPLESNRAKRSIITNEIPEDPVHFKPAKKRFNIPQTHPNILKTRSESRIKIKDAMLIPYPKKDVVRRNRKRKHRRRKKKNKNRKNKRKNTIYFPAEWKDFHPNSVKTENSEKLCGRKRLIVDFADIGWGDWIISPKSFEAHYCAGSCPFPLTKRLRPSNHATIQSMVHAIGINKEVPEPCCVPESMSSLTLLYFDENRNVVLKNYPSMTVNSCACL